MQELTLQDFLVKGTQQQVADALGVRQSAVAQMVAAGRDIRVQVDDSGVIQGAYEVKPLGRKGELAA